MGFIAGSNHACKMRHGALVGILGILIFDKRAFAVEMFEFGALFLNQVRLAGLKVGCMNELERSHVSDAYCMDTLDFNSIFYEFLSRCAMCTKQQTCYAFLGFLIHKFERCSFNSIK